MNAARRSGRKKGIAGGPKVQKLPPHASAETEKRGADPLRRGAIGVFILFHLVAIAFVAMPINLSVVRGVRELFLPYLRWTGLYQTWDMFAPDPEMVNSYVKSVIITQDRHMRVWSFPRMEELGPGARYQKERYRKFLEVLPQPQNAVMWPDVAAHLARSLNSKSDPPDKIMLIQFQSDIHTGQSHDPDPRPNVFYDDYLPPGTLP